MIERLDGARRVLANASVAAAWVFGSRAEGKERADSDADVAILAGRRLDLLEAERIAARLTEALGNPKVDLVVLDRASLELRGYIIQTGRLIYSGDDAARVAFEVRTRSEYFDFEPTLRSLGQRFVERVAERGLRG